MSLNSFAQELADTTYNKLYRNSFALGLHFSTQGWGIYGEYTKQKNYKYHHVLAVQISSIHHKNEFKTTANNGRRNFFYYKINSFVSLRPTIGGNYKVFESRRDNGIEVQFKWKVGPSIGLLKPVYLDIGNPSDNGFTREERYDPDDHGYSVIQGKASWFRGLGESSIRIGIHQKLGFNFNFSKMNEGISGGEIGFLVDYFPTKQVEIMYGTDNYKVFTGFYLQFELGNKF
ncbi:MAG: hypothetical protein AB8B74_11660 [Crocinitomicaceae bacterium]